MVTVRNRQLMIDILKLQLSDIKEYVDNNSTNHYIYINGILYYMIRYILTHFIQIPLIKIKILKKITI